MAQENKEVNMVEQNKINKKKLLSLLFILSLIPMLFYQYGSKIGVVAFLGIINLTNPIGIVAVVLFFIGVWGKFKSQKFNVIFAYIGMIGVVLSEIYELLTWNYPNTSYLDGIKNCFNNVFPMFYVGLISSIIMILAYKIVDKKLNNWIIE